MASMGIGSIPPAEDPTIQSRKASTAENRAVKSGRRRSGRKRVLSKAASQGTNSKLAKTVVVSEGAPGFSASEKSKVL